MAALDYFGKNALVIGLGISGKSAAEFLLRRGASVHGVDSREDVLHGNPETEALKQLGLSVGSDQIPIDLAPFNLAIVSPGIPQQHPLYAAAVSHGLEVWGEIELGCRGLSNRIIGITGTNGKTTVTKLVEHALNHAGIKARALGNVGIPLTKEVASVGPDEVIVLELSSFQLETFRQRALDCAVLLNITPDHLDRYASMEDYGKAKFAIEKALKSQAHLYVEHRTYEEFGHLSDWPLTKTYGFSADCQIYSDGYQVLVNGKPEWDLPQILQGTGNFNLENSLAAYALCRECGIGPGPFLKALETFKKPSHRLEFIAEKNGIVFYDDSKGTNIDAVMRAVQSFSVPIILIAGGVDKGAAYTPWLESFADKVKMICAIGQAAGKMRTQLSHKIPVNIYNNLEQAVKAAVAYAENGNCVLLSPGCSSYDMFRDYAQRGEEFQRLVHQL